MRCVCCNKILSDLESTRKHANTGDYLDMCNKCLSFCPDIPTLERTDLKNSESEETDDYDLEEQDDDEENQDF